MLARERLGLDRLWKIWVCEDGVTLREKADESIASRGRGYASSSVVAYNIASLFKMHGKGYDATARIDKIGNTLLLKGSQVKLSDGEYNQSLRDFISVMNTINSMKESRVVDSSGKLVRNYQLGPESAGIAAAIVEGNARGSNKWKLVDESSEYVLNDDGSQISYDEWRDLQ